MEKTSVLLVAEDDPDDRLLIQDAVDGACPRWVVTRFVEDGIELLDYLQRKVDSQPRPRLVLLDLNMPRKDGRTALREMKADPLIADIPVVILTTSRAEEDLHFCQQHGADGYYRKPSKMSDLEGILSQLCLQYLS